MIKGLLKLDFEEEKVSVETDIRLTDTFSDKCFIVDCVCNALKMNREEKLEVLTTVAIAGVNLTKEDEE